jgi:hypothetical protein
MDGQARRGTVVYVAAPELNNPSIEPLTESRSRLVDGIMQRDSATARLNYLMLQDVGKSLSCNIEVDADLTKHDETIVLHLGQPRTH